MAIDYTADPQAAAERCAQASPATPVLIFAGAGISVEYPAAIPGVWWMLHSTLQYTLPELPTLPTNPTPGQQFAHKQAADALNQEREYIHGVMAEIYYEILCDLLEPDQDVMHVWEALRFWIEAPELRAFDLRPNLGHLVAVYLAWRSGTPIITTNFDTMFEGAAVQLGLQPLVGCEGSTLPQPVTGSASVAIWKLHGSVDAALFDTILSTLRDLTRLDKSKIVALEKQYHKAGCTPVFLGYSGRDLDLFPYIGQFRFQQAIWIDPGFGNPRAEAQHVLSALPPDQDRRFAAVKAKGSEWAGAVIDQLSGSDVHLMELRRIAAIPTVDRSHEVSAEFEQLLLQHAGRILRPLLPAKDAKRLLIHAFAMNAVGQRQLCIHYCDEYLDRTARDLAADQRLRIRTLLLRAQALHDLARFEESERDAKQAAELAKAKKKPLLHAQACFAIDEALRSQHFPRLSLQDHLLLLQPQSWLTLLRFVLDNWRFKRVIERDPKHPDYWRAACLQLEHSIRLGSIPHGAIERLRLGKLLGWLIFRFWWSDIGNRCLEIGYAAGYGAACRYAERMGFPLAHGASAVFEILKDPTGRTIAHRDRAERLLAQANRASSAADYEELRQRARKEIDATEEEGDRVGDASLVLKALVLRRQADPDFRVPRDRVLQLLSLIQGAGYQAARRRLLRRLCDG